MKNIITAVLLSFGFVFATAQRLPPRPPHPSHAKVKHPGKKIKKHKKPKKQAANRPVLMTPDGQKFRLGDTPPQPKRRPPLPPKPPHR